MPTTGAGSTGILAVATAPGEEADPDADAAGGLSILAVGPGATWLIDQPAQYLNNTQARATTIHPDASTPMRGPPATTTSTSVTGLTNGTAYAVQIRGVNSVGSGAASATVIGTPRTVPGAPTIDGNTIVATPRPQHSPDSTFDVARFLEGAQAAYRMVLEACWKGDREELTQLASADALTRSLLLITINCASSICFR